MNPKKKAKELFDKFYYLSDLKLDYEQQVYKSKQYGIILINELIYSHSQDATDNQFYYWQEVKQEIEKL